MTDSIHQVNDGGHRTHSQFPTLFDQESGHDNLAVKPEADEADADLMDHHSDKEREGTY